VTVKKPLGVFEGIVEERHDDPHWSECQYDEQQHFGSDDRGDGDTDKK
jgi:hypothetical protein